MFYRRNRTFIATVSGIGLGFLTGCQTFCPGVSQSPLPCSDEDGAFLTAAQVPLGESVRWENGRTGYWGWYCPVREGHSECGNYCREFVSTICVNGRLERVYGTACRHPNGSWYRI